ncbi:unnamed protein product [Brachionus calyciflorus]|uniref:Uncharacterized protein n=1 Tax=Brachionus calyciflorus TaxID=104777 RepID=A0A814RI30_9BILA|nr:unnamed protein product [Brachionus calyciflorus]
MINCTGLVETELIRELNEYYSRTLHYEFCLNNRSHNFLENLIKILSLTPKINIMFKDVEINNLEWNNNFEC